MIQRVLVRFKNKENTQCHLMINFSIKLDCFFLFSTGSTSKVPKDSEEEAFAKEALFTRHPNFNDYPIGNRNFKAQLEPKTMLFFCPKVGALEIVPS